METCKNLLLVISECRSVWGMQLRGSSTSIRVIDVCPPKIACTSISTKLWLPKGRKPFQRRPLPPQRFQTVGKPNLKLKRLQKRLLLQLLQQTNQAQWLSQKTQVVIPSKENLEAHRKTKQRKGTMVPAQGIAIPAQGRSQSRV